MPFSRQRRIVGIELSLGIQSTSASANKAIIDITLRPVLPPGESLSAYDVLAPVSNRAAPVESLSVYAPLVSLLPESLCENMTSSTKPEVLRHASEQTATETRLSQYFAPYT